MRYKIFSFVKPIILLILVTSPSISVAEYVVKINVCHINEMNPPYVLHPDIPNIKYAGITIDFLDQVEHELDLKFNFISQPWYQCLENLKNNRIDATFHASYTKERSQYGVYPLREGMPDADRRLLTQTYYIYKHKDSPLNWDGKSFSNLSKPVSAMTRFSVVKDLKKMRIAVEETSDVALNLRKVVSGEVDAFINYASQTDAALKKNEELANVIEKIQIPYREKIKYLLFSRGFYQQNGELVEDIWDALERLRKNGKFSQIEADYLLTEFSFISPD